MKYFTEREFSGIFSLAGGGFCIFEKGIPGGPDYDNSSSGSSDDCDAVTVSP